ncbi:DNA-binding response regulator, partial [Streptomyces sp. F8]|nr:DNA-binding response regulator [Streptomyces sp. F8]
MITGSRPDTEASADVGAGAAALATRHRAGLDGLEATPRRSGSDRPRIVTVTVTTFDLDEYVPAALHGGSSGFLPTFEDASPATLVEPVRAGSAAPRSSRRP